jgi:hypothetical protein
MVSPVGMAMPDNLVKKQYIKKQPLLFKEGAVAAIVKNYNTW